MFYVCIRKYKIQLLMNVCMNILDYGHAYEYFLSLKPYLQPGNWLGIVSIRFSLTARK